jgi:uncharacterized protein YecE (DUF72 family)
MQSEAMVRIGTSGYSFDAWRGEFYPMDVTKKGMLNHYASIFDTVELNYTFYGLPMRRTSKNMIQQVPDDFTFIFKANQSFTHRFDLTHASTFLSGIDPIVEAGCFGGLLFQFPAAFKNTTTNRDYVKRIVRQFSEYALSIEFRHCTWDAPFVRRYFEDNGLCLVIADVPEISYLYPRIVASTSDVSYVRFHSRNADLWNAGKQRYDYDYSQDELKEWLPLLSTMAERSPTIYAFFNNCYRGQAALNAEAFKEIIRNADGPLKIPETKQAMESIQGGLWA